MATDILSNDVTTDDQPPRPLRQVTAIPAIERVLRPLASLKLTVTLFGLAIFLVLAGTLAQTTHDIWWVLHHYFRAPLAWIELRVFFPPAWWADYPSLQNLTWAFPYPGGFTIGGLMALNLLAAHGLRFRTQAKGSRLWAGVAVIAAGCVITWLAIAAGPDKDGSQATAPVEWVTLWRLFLLGLVGAVAGLGASAFTIEKSRRTERIVLACVGVVLFGLLAFLFHIFGFSADNINPSAMRILWQLLKAEFAALVLLTGCALVFRKRAGIVLLHAGVGLIMANELVVHFLHKEGQMSIIEGGTANYTFDLRTTELAIVDHHSSAKTDDVFAIPQGLLESSLKNHSIITNGELPFEIRILKYYENSELSEDSSPGENLADAGAGAKGEHAVEVASVTGAGGGDRVNLPAAYAQFLDKSTGKSLGAYLLQIELKPQRVMVGDKPYYVALQFQRDYKPYTIQLHDVNGDKYLGTEIPRNFSSKIQLVDHERGVDRQAQISMNAPLRYGGETFYQSGFDDGMKGPHPTGVKSTTLQVVANFGWMIPYVACMVVITGMLAQFLITLARFLNRNKLPATEKLTGWSNWIVPAAVLGLFAYCVWSAMTPPEPQYSSIDLYAAGQLPIVYGGRVQPLDSVARSTLRNISSREVFVDNNGVTQPAMRWLMDVIARPKMAEQHRVFRVDSPEVRDMLGLEIHQPTNFFGKLFGDVVQRYSPGDLAPHAEEFQKQVDPLVHHDKSRTALFTTTEKKLVELWERGSAFQAVADAFHLTPELNSELAEPAPVSYVRLIEQRLADAGKGIKVPFFPTITELHDKDTQERAFQTVQLWLQLNEALPYDRLLELEQPPLAIPAKQSATGEPADETRTAQVWMPYATAWLSNVEDILAGEQPNPAVAQWQEIIEAYSEQNAIRFNAAVADYAKSLNQNPPAQLAKASPEFEAWFNHAELFSLAQWFYFFAFCLIGFFWLTGWRPLNRAAFWLIVGVFLVHTFALVARMMISGRPPVTNLYSTALFIGWAGVLLGSILELVFYRLGFGAAIAAIAGFATLIIADKLSLVVDSETRGDTIGVMRAVLDTQFWLATHVTTINTGYATTYIAGLLGLLYVVAGVFTRAVNKENSKLLARMIYGALCFAMFFSFFGTVLGGLWADDSWGRFWGWDPKENGALMIVLWNALVLHARWDGLVKDRGLAVLAIAGNIVVSWSYFGVNQLGVGLHSYGFTEGVLLALGIYCASQLAMIGLGLLPRRYWRSAAT